MTDTVDVTRWSPDGPNAHFTRVEPPGAKELEETNIESVAETIHEEVINSAHDSDLTKTRPIEDFYWRIDYIVKENLDHEAITRFKLMSMDNYDKGMTICQRVIELINPNTRIDKNRQRNILAAISCVHGAYLNQYNNAHTKTNVSESEPREPKLHPEPDGAKNREPKGAQPDDDTKLKALMLKIESTQFTPDELIDLIKELDEVKSAHNQNKTISVMLGDIISYYFAKYEHETENKNRNFALAIWIGQIANTFNDENNVQFSTLRAALTSLDRFLDLIIDTSYDPMNCIKQ